MNALELSHVSKRYKDFELNDLSLTLPGGCILGLIGENGAGKSTTIKLILEIIRKDSGTIRVLGHDMETEGALVKEDIGVVLDDNGIPSALNAEKINKIMALAYRRWNSALFFDLLERLSVPRNKSYGDFSRGMKMKMGISIALAHDPKLLIFDEATNGLDPVARDEVVNMLFEFTRDENHSILISSHIVSDLEKLCDYIAFVHKGKLMLMEEKDRLYEDYGTIHVTPEQAAAIDPKAIVGRRQSSYSVELLVKRSRIPADIPVGPISLEELFVFMVKNA